MRWKVDLKYFGRVIKCTFDEVVFDRAMLVAERSRVFLLSDKSEYDGSPASDKRGFKYSFWTAANYDSYIVGLGEVRLARKYNHEQE
jgi:hypothetical protein